MHVGGAIISKVHESALRNTAIIWKEKSNEGGVRSEEYTQTEAQREEGRRYIIQ